MDGSYVYDVGNLQVPALVVPTPALALAFDDAAERIYVGFLGTVRVLTASGQEEASLKVGGSTNRIEQILVRPQGHAMMVLADEALTWIDLSEP